MKALLIGLLIASGVILLAMLLLWLWLWAHWRMPPWQPSETRHARRRAWLLARATLPWREYLGLRMHGELRIPSALIPHRVYMVRHPGWCIEVHEGNRMVDRLCYQMTTIVPSLDHTLALRLWLIADEARLLAEANHFVC